MTSKKIIALILLIAGNVSMTYASNSDSTVYLKARWAKYSTKNFEITRCRTKSNAKDGQFLHQCSTTYVMATIKDSTATGYLINWYCENVSLDESYKNADAISKYILQITKGMTITFSTDSAGSFKSIVNWDDIKSFLTLRSDSMANKLGATNPEVVTGIHTKFMTLINSKDQLQTVLLQDIQLYFSLYGYVLNRKAPLGYDGFFPNLFGGDPFPSHGAIKLTSVNAQNNECEVTWHQQADSNKIKDVLIKSLGQEARIAGRPEPTASDVPHIRIYDDYYYLYDLQTGWSRTLTYKRTTATDKMQQTDSVDFKVY